MKNNKDSKEIIKLNINATKINSARITLGKETIIVSTNGLIEIQNYIIEIIKFNQFWNSMVERYKGFDGRVIEELLNEQEKQNVDLYYMGENFAEFLGITNISIFRIPDNNLASELIKKDYTKDAGKLFANKLIFRPDTNYCHIYTKDRKIATHFLEWSYKKVIEPKLKKIS